MRLCVKIFVLLFCGIGSVESSQSGLAVLASLHQWAKNSVANITLEKYNFEQYQDHDKTTPSPKRTKASSPSISEDGATSESDSSVENGIEDFLTKRSASFKRLESQSNTPSRLGARSMPPFGSRSSMSINSIDESLQTPFGRSHSQGNSLDCTKTTPSDCTKTTPSPRTPKK